MNNVTPHTQRQKNRKNIGNVISFRYYLFSVGCIFLALLILCACKQVETMEKARHDEPITITVTENGGIFDDMDAFAVFSEVDE